MANRSVPRARKAQSLPIPDTLLRRFLESISMLEVFQRSLDDEHAPEQLALQVVIRELHEVHTALDRLTLPTPAERLRRARAMPVAWFTSPAARKQLIAEAQADVAAERSLQ